MLNLVASFAVSAGSQAVPCAVPDAVHSGLVSRACHKAEDGLRMRPAGACQLGLCCVEPARHGATLPASAALALARLTISDTVKEG